MWRFPKPETESFVVLDLLLFAFPTPLAFHGGNYLTNCLAHAILYTEAAAAAGDAAGMGATALRALCGDDSELRRRAIAAGAKPVVFAEA